MNPWPEPVVGAVYYKTVTTKLGTYALRQRFLGWKNVPGSYGAGAILVRVDDNAKTSPPGTRTVLARHCFLQEYIREEYDPSGG